MVHPDIDVTGCDQLFDRHFQYRKPLIRRWQSLGRHYRLVLFEPRHMRVIKDGNPIWRDVDDLIDRFRKRINRLIWQAVDQIEIDTLESELSRPLDRLSRNFLRLKTIYRLLDL